MHVIILSLGPVQDFIATARKCRDLWFGSWVLSELCRTTARRLAELEGRPETEVLAFPGAATSDRSRAVANKIVARVQRDPRVLVERAELAMRARLRQIRDAAFARIAPQHPRRSDLFKIDTARSQVDDLIELLWAAAPEDEGYATARDEAERLLGAVKASKAWEQPPWAQDGVVKSSLDGVRESVLHESLYDNPRGDVAAGFVDARKRRREFGVHGAERLCGVGLLKRFGNRDADEEGNALAAEKLEQPHRIFSTPHVASGPFRAGLAAVGAATAWDRFRDELAAGGADLLAGLDVVPREDATTGRVDGSVFYEARLVEEIEEVSETPAEARTRAVAATKALRRFLRSVSELGEPDPYYAILLADGDHMGSVIDHCRDFTSHRDLSAALEGFASATRGTVREHDGSLVYAGGDDVLALVPLHRLLPCARRLASDFAEAMKHWRAHVDGGERPATLSVGVAVVHQSMPLDEALELVRQAEKRAKKVEGKNGLAITVQRRGGEAIEISGSFAVDPLPQRLSYLAWLHRTDAISAKAQYELMDLAGRTRGAGDAELAGTLRDVARAEARRILARKQPRRGDEANLDEAVMEALGAHRVFDDPARLGRELYVAAEIARAEEQARIVLRDPRAPNAGAEVAP